jgi:hypothetical protein
MLRANRAPKSRCDIDERQPKVLASLERLTLVRAALA